ncbi:MAG: 50S ribosomal protein L23 [Leptolyngbya sp. PLA1]|nr:50S ribosomal protein L23 [Leptolyngbya sp. PLA1]
MPAHIDATQIIKRPLLSEKSTYGMNERNHYSFIVDVRATKTEIKSAVESIFKVKVVGINTQVQKHKARRLKYGVTRPSPTKKAIVRLAEGEKIELF